MSNFEQETLRLIDAIPANGDRHELEVPGECPLAFDASGVKQDVFERLALSKEVAEALSNEQNYVAYHVRDNPDPRSTFFPSPDRYGEYAKCLLKRAMGECVQYDPEERRERTESEIILGDKRV